MIGRDLVAEDYYRKLMLPAVCCSTRKKLSAGYCSAKTYFTTICRFFLFGTLNSFSIFMYKNKFYIKQYIRLNSKRVREKNCPPIFPLSSSYVSKDYGSSKYYTINNANWSKQNIKINAETCIPAS